MSKFILLKDLEIYKLARELSNIGWDIYENLSWQNRKIMGDQFIESLDSVGANIAEGYFRYHYLDKIKFFYISRASLVESCDHWLELLYERSKIEKDKYERLKEVKIILAIKLNNFINSIYNLKANKKNSKSL